MESVYANASVSITELKKNPTAVLEQSEGFPVMILNHNKPTAYLVPVAAYEALMEKLEDAELAQLVKKRENEPRVKVTLDEL